MLALTWWSKEPLTKSPVSIGYHATLHSIIIEVLHTLFEVASTYSDTILNNSATDLTLQA